MADLIRVFPRRTSMTPTDSYVFIGDPPLWRPEADEVHISVAFTWDIKRGYELMESWGQYYPNVKIGGPAFTGRSQATFKPGIYIKPGITFTSRGCNKSCPWCLVPEREGKLQTIPIQPGYIVQDNNLLQCPCSHLDMVFAMLRGQRRAITFSGGLDTSLIDDYVVEQLRSLRIKEIFMAADTQELVKPLHKAVAKLSFLPRDKLRCYVLIGYNNETIEQAQDRLEEVWEAGCLPFAQLYRPANRSIDWPTEWRQLARVWSRPAAMKAIHKVKIELIEFHGEPAVLFEDGDIIMQNDSLSSFLMHLSLLMPDCELPDTLLIE